MTKPAVKLLLWRWAMRAFRSNRSEMRVVSSWFCGVLDGRAGLHESTARRTLEFSLLGPQDRGTWLKTLHLSVKNPHNCFFREVWCVCENFCCFSSEERFWATAPLVLMARSRSSLTHEKPPVKGRTWHLEILRCCVEKDLLSLLNPAYLFCRISQLQIVTSLWKKNTNKNNNRCHFFYCSIY